MDEKQFEELMTKLEEIRCGVVDVEINTEPKKDAKDLLLVLSGIRDAFHHQLEAKTGWGRKEVKQLLENAIDAAVS